MRAVDLFRAFFPSWRFFDDFGEVPELVYRLISSDLTDDVWRPCFQRPSRNWHSLLVNPAGNAYLAQASVVQQLVNELPLINDTNPIEETVPYCLIKHWVATVVRAHSNAPHTAYQFKIIARSFEHPEGEDVLLSPEFNA